MVSGTARYTCKMIREWLIPKYINKGEIDKAIECLDYANKREEKPFTTLKEEYPELAHKIIEYETKNIKNNTNPYMNIKLNIKE